MSMMAPIFLNIRNSIGTTKDNENKTKGTSTSVIFSSEF